MDVHAAKRQARIDLCADAEWHRSQISGDAWAERAEETVQGRLLGALEIEAIVFLIFGRKALKRSRY